MAKPVITRRQTKGTPLTYSELDTNFDNLRDSTVSLRAGSAGTTVASDLNGVITLVAGSGISLAGDNTAKTVTITNTGAGGSFYDHGFLSGAGGSAPGTAWTPNYSQGQVQRIQLESGYWYLGVPTNMTAGTQLTILFKGLTSTSYIVTLNQASFKLSSDNGQNYFESYPTPLTVLPDGWARLHIIYDGDYYWITVHSNYFNA
jgi:hypothetical protein